VPFSNLALFIFSCLYVPAAAMALISLFNGLTTNPGAVPMGARPLEVSASSTDNTGIEEGRASSRRGTRRCRKCNDNYKPPRAHHDSVTGRCIVKMDHFCPWVGNAVGALNHKYFFLFILYTIVTSILSFLLLGMRLVRCGYQTKRDVEGEDDDANMEYKFPGCDVFYSNPTMILSIVSVAFLIFTCTMMTEQIETISSNMSKIARLKMRAGRGDTSDLAPVGTNFNEMFGGDSPSVSLHWFLPWVKVQFPDGMHDAVMGFEYDPRWGDVPFQDSVEDEFTNDPFTEDREKTTLRAGGAAVPDLPLRAVREEETYPASNDSIHSTSSSGTRNRKAVSEREQPEIV
jgi:hypothetical protein